MFSVEYYFGGGIQATPEGHFQSSNQMPPDQLISLGTTTKTQAELIAYLRSVNHLYTQHTYDLINNNCNNFSDCICKFLLNGRGIPSEIVDLPRIVFSTPGGAMLRPMIENMQNNIRSQSGAGIDPFAAAATIGGGAMADGRVFENELSNSVRAAVMDLVHERTSTSTGSIATASLEETCLVSSDSSSVMTLSKKIVGVKDKEGRRLLTDKEVLLLETIAKDLVGDVSIAANISCPIEGYDVLERLISECLQVQLPCLFIVRLLMLHESRTDFRRVGLLRSLLRRLVSAASDPSQFASPSAHVLAVCAVSNLMGNLHGASCVLSDGNDESLSISNDVVDISLHGLNHAKTEMRLISATLAYNYVLYHTKDDHQWMPSPNNDTELHPHAMQLLLGALEGLAEEGDPQVLRRRLSVVCRIIRAYGAVAAELVRDLGLADLFNGLCSRGGKESLGAAVVDIVNEIKQRIRS